MVDEEQREHVRRTSDELPKTCKNSLELGVEDGIVKGFDRVFNDPERCRRFWQSGFDTMFDHSRANTSRWIGSRILTWFLTAIVVGILGWLIRSGALAK